MNWLSAIPLLAKIVELANRFFRWVERRDAEALGRLREREDQAKADEELRDLVGDPARRVGVSDDEAFGPGEQNDDLRGA